MRKLLIVESSEELRGALVELLRRTYDITVCGDGGTAVTLLHTLRPDGMILDLILPVKDGFCVLEETADCLPSVVLGISDFTNPYINQTALDLGVSYMVVKPCQPRVIAARLDHLMDHVPSPRFYDGQTRTAEILLRMRFNPKNDGYRFLKVGIPLYAQDPQQRVCKELYTAIASICGAGSWNQVERSIRTAIDNAWASGAAEWARYFPGRSNPPTGKSFISRVAQMLQDSENELL